MRRLAFVLCLPLLSLAAGRPPDLAALADAARTAPPEFSADALIRIAGIDKLDKSKRAGLYEEAFRRASGAHEPMRRRSAIEQFDGQTGFLERAYAQELDAMSLQMRAIEGLLEVDPPKARDLFMQVTAPAPPKATCKDALVYDVSRFYRVLGRVASETFSAKEIQEEEPFKLLSKYVVPVSPVQIGPIARLLANTKVTESQFLSLLASYQAGMKEIAGDDRSFTAERPAAIQLKALVTAIRRWGASPVPLVETYRAYLVRHMTAVRCADNVRIAVKMTMGGVNSQTAEMQEAINAGGYFNDTLRVDPVPPLTVEEQITSKTDGEAEGVKGCTSPECTALGKQYTALIMKPGHTALGPADKNTAEWQNQLKEYLAAIAAWTQDSAADATGHFRFKCLTYSDLLNVVPNGSAREMVLRAMLDYLKRSRLDVENPMEWFLPVNTLIGRVSLDPLGLGPLLDEFRESGDPVIGLYARLEQAAPRTPDRIMQLL